MDPTDALIKHQRVPRPANAEVLDPRLKLIVRKDLERTLKQISRCENPETFQQHLTNMRNISIRYIQEIKQTRKLSGQLAPQPPMGCATGSLLTAFLVAFIVIGMLWFCLVERMPAIDAMYLIVIIFTTVGYGMKDELETQRLQLFLIFYVSFGVCLIFTGVNFYFARTLGRMLTHVEEPQEGSEDQEESDKYSYGSLSELHDTHACAIDFQWLLLGWLAWLLGGAYLIAELEDWSFLEATYFAVISGSTVGFGDFEPEDIRTKYFIIFYLPPLIVFTLFIFTHSFAVSVKFFVDETLSPHTFNNTQITGLNTPSAISFRSSMMNNRDGSLLDRFSKRESTQP